MDTVVEVKTIEDLIPGMGDAFMRLLPHADEKLRARIERFYERPEAKRSHEEFRRIILALFDAEARSPEAVAKRKATQARLRRGEFQVSRCQMPDGTTSRSIQCGDLRRMDRLLRLERVEDPETGDELCPTRAELTAAYWAALARPRAPRKLIERAFRAYLFYLSLTDEAPTYGPVAA